MKLFYLTALDILDKKKCGILGKINGQINSFKHQGNDVHFGHFYGKNEFLIENQENVYSIDVIGGNTRKRLASVYEEIYKYIEGQLIDVVYIRFTSLDSKAIRFYKQLKQNNILVIIEFYSHNLELEAKKTIVRELKKKKCISAIKGCLSLIINKYYFRKLHSVIDLIVTTTKVGKLYGVPTLNVINGVDTFSIDPRKKVESEYDFNIISVAMISPWHGYDRIIRGISDYYKNDGKLNIMYKVIGDGEERRNLQSLVKNLHLEDHVIFTGIKLANELDSYYAEADIALEMLAGFRRTNGQISSIKMAEYFAKGIPVIYAADNQLYEDSMEKYCYRVSNDDSTISVGAIIDFINDLEKVDNLEIKMHSIAHEKFDWDITMLELHKFIQENRNEKNRLM